MASVLAMNRVQAVYETVYEIRWLPSSGLWHGFLFLVLGVGSLVVAIRRLGKAARSSVHRGFLLVWGVVAASMGGFATVVLLKGHVAAYRAYRRGQGTTVEGAVHVLREQPYTGHAPGDLIEIGGEQIEVNYFVEQPGYHQSIAHGGALREGAAVRCLVHDGLILRLDVRRAK